MQLFGGSATNWLGSRDTALFAVIVVAVWKEAGFFMIFYLAALQGIPQAWARRQPRGGLALVLLPAGAFSLCSLPTTLFVLINAMINAFRMVDLSLS